MICLCSYLFSRCWRFWFSSSQSVKVPARWGPEPQVWPVSNGGKGWVTNFLIGGIQFDDKSNCSSVVGRRNMRNILWGYIADQWLPNEIVWNGKEQILNIQWVLILAHQGEETKDGESAIGWLLSKVPWCGSAFHRGWWAFLCENVALTHELGIFVNLKT